MRILMFGWEFPPFISGGLAVACHGMTRGLSQRGHRITFVLPALKETTEAKATHVELLGSNQIPLGEVPRRVPDMPGVEFEAIRSILRPYMTDLEYRRILQRLEAMADFTQPTFNLHLTGDYGPDLMSEVARYAAIAGAIAHRVPHYIIHAHDWLTALAGLAAREVSGKPVVLHIHALEFDRCGENVNQDVYSIERYAMHRADRVIAVSNYTKRLIVDRYAVPEDKVHVVYNGADAASAESRRTVQRGVKEKVVLFLGRITFQKGPEYFVEAAARVLSVRKDVRFVMAGSGDMAPRMVELVARHRIGRHFHFTGFLRGGDVQRMYAHSDLFIMPSVSEPFGIAPLEAVRHDVPVIISKQSGVAEVLPNALKVDFWDVNELANLILALLDHPPLIREMSSRSQKDIENIHWLRAADQIGEIYHTLAPHAG